MFYLMVFGQQFVKNKKLPISGQPVDEPGMD
jgi:hypothetical protein